MSPALVTSLATVGVVLLLVAIARLRGVRWATARQRLPRAGGVMLAVLALDGVAAGLASIAGLSSTLAILIVTSVFAAVAFPVRRRMRH